MTDGADPRLRPATTTLHLDFNAGEGATDEVTVIDDHGVPVPLSSAVGTVAQTGCDGPLHQWTTDGGGLALADQRTRPGVLWLRTTGEDTAGWTAWGDASWQLDAVDIFAREHRPCRGRVRVWSGLRDGEGSCCT